MSEIKLFNKWTIKKRSLWIALGGTALVFMILILSPFLLFNGSSRYSQSMADYEFDMAESMGVAMEAPAAEPMYYGGDEMSMDLQADDAYYKEASALNSDQSASLLPLVQTERIIIKEGTLSIAVEDSRLTRSSIEQIVFSLRDKGAFIVSSFENQNYDTAMPNINMVIRVPYQEFEIIMDQLAEMAVEVSYRNEFSDDVTAQYVDIENRINAYEIARQRLLEIMENADTTEDLLYAEQKLTEREAELESLKGQLKYLGEAALLSRISIEIYPYRYSQPVDYSWKPLNTLRNAYEALINSLENFADFLIVFTILYLPWLLLFGFIIWLVVRISKRRTAKQQAKAAQQE